MHKTEPATVVGEYYKSLRNWISSSSDLVTWTPNIWAFGYDLESAKAKCWYESVFPLFNLGTEDINELADQARKVVDAASATLDILKKSLKIALFRDPKNDPNAKSFLKKSVYIDTNFWTATEPDFYSLLQRLVDSLDDEIEINKLLDSWRKTLKHEATVLFDQYALSILNEDGDLKRVIMARDGEKVGLQHYLNRSKALKALVA